MDGWTTLYPVSNGGATEGSPVCHPSRTHKKDLTCHHSVSHLTISVLPMCSSSSIWNPGPWTSVVGSSIGQASDLHESSSSCAPFQRAPTWPTPASRSATQDRADHASASCHWGQQAGDPRSCVSHSPSSSRQANRKLAAGHLPPRPLSTHHARCSARLLLLLFSCVGVVGLWVRDRLLPEERLVSACFGAIILFFHRQQNQSCRDAERRGKALTNLTHTRVPCFAWCAARRSPRRVATCPS